MSQHPATLQLLAATMAVGPRNPVVRVSGGGVAPRKEPRLRAPPPCSGEARSLQLGVWLSRWLSRWLCRLPAGLAGLQVNAGGGGRAATGAAARG